MTGPQHFKSGEDWLFKAEHPDARGDSETVESCAAIARAHFAAAHVAATSDLLALYGQVSDESKQAWREVLAP